MRFVRVALNRTTGEVQGVIEQETPFDRGGVISHGIDGVEHQVEMLDLGAVEDHDWRDHLGRPCSPARHIHTAIAKSALKAEHFDRGEVKAEHLGVRAVHACPCTHASIAAHMRTKGRNHEIPVKVRAWLALMLPDHARAFGVARGIPVSVLKAMEQVRYKRDPGSGSRLPRLERIAQRISDARSAKALKARNRGK